MQPSLRWGAVLLLIALVGWLGAPHLRPLTGLVTNTKRLVGATQAILAETQSLQDSVKAVEQNLAELEQQEMLLREQERLMGDMLTAMREQEQLALGATDLLTEILKTERQTAELTAKAGQASADSMQTVSANAKVLEQLAASTGRIGQGSRRIDGQLDQMLIQLNASKENFAIIAKVKSGAKKATERTKNWFNSILEWFGW